jgi:predicted TIM-barrel fold metal-dependent hydrolase
VLPTLRIKEHGVQDLEVIDAHTHFGDAGATGVSGIPGGGATKFDEAFQAEDVLTRTQTMDERGVSKAVILGGHGYLRPNGVADTRDINDGVVAYTNRNPERFLAAVGIVEPLYGPAGLAELDRCKEIGIRGISFHTRQQGVSVNSPWVRAYLERMGELGLVPFLHAFAESELEALWKIGAMAADMPDLPIIALDAFCTTEQASYVPYVAEQCPNVVFETSLAHGWSYPAGIVSRFGASRIVYGSDLYSSTEELDATGGVMDKFDLLQPILNSGLPEEDIALIVGGNIRSLLGLQ